MAQPSPRSPCLRAAERPTTWPPPPGDHCRTTLTSRELRHRRRNSRPASTQMGLEGPIYGPRGAAGHARNSTSPRNQRRCRCTEEPPHQAGPPPAELHRRRQEPLRHPPCSRGKAGPAEHAGDGGRGEGGEGGWRRGGGLGFTRRPWGMRSEPAGPRKGVQGVFHRPVKIITKRIAKPYILFLLCVSYFLLILWCYVPR